MRLTKMTNTSNIFDEYYIKVELVVSREEYYELYTMGGGEFSIIDLEKAKQDLEALKKAAMFQ